MFEKIILILGSFLLGGILLLWSERKIGKTKDKSSEPAPKQIHSSPAHPEEDEDDDDLYEQGFQDGIRHAIEEMKKRGG
jgi:hypothetical protein